MWLFRKNKKREPAIILYAIEGPATTNAELERIFGQSFETDAKALERSRQKLLRAWSR